MVNNINNPLADSSSDFPPSKETDLLRSIFDAMPSRIFLVDDDVRIIKYNAAAGRLLDVDNNLILNRRGGDVFHCIHSFKSPKGCGHSQPCRQCVIRNSVIEAINGKRIVRRRTRIQIRQDKKTEDLYAMISTSPFQFQQKELALLVIEDVSDMAVLQNMIPICSICHKIRDEKAAWYRMEAYFQEYWDVDFSHSLCPECIKREMEKLD